MDTSKQNEAVESKDVVIAKSKGEDYFRIWESWGYTKQEWEAIEKKREA